MRKNPVPPQRSTLPSRGCVAVLAAARIAEDHGQKGYRVRIIEGLGRYPYPRAGDHPSGTRTGAPAPIPERPGGLEGKQADTGPTAPRLIQQCMKERPFQAVLGENRTREYELGWDKQVSSWCAQEVRGQRIHAVRNRRSPTQPRRNIDRGKTC